MPFVWQHDKSVKFRLWQENGIKANCSRRQTRNPMFPKRIIKPTDSRTRLALSLFKNLDKKANQT